MVNQRSWHGLAGLLLLPSVLPASESPTHSTPSPWFREEAAARGIDFRHESGQQPGRFLFPEIHTGGVAVLDADQDGDLDIYLVQAGDLESAPEDRSANQLYLNRGEGRFDNRSVDSGADDRGYGMGVATGDYNNDGRIDLYVTNVGPNVLLENQGSGRFVDRTAKAGVALDGWSSSAAFFDYDLDGDLDLFVASYLNWTVAGEVDCFDAAGRLNYCGPAKYDTPAADVLYRNVGEGRFEDVTREANLHLSFGTGLGVAMADFDDNGWPDIFVANDGMLDQLWLNQGDGTFRDEAVFRGCAADLSGQPKAGMGVAVADIDRDGRIDLAVCNLGGETDSVFLNRGEYFDDHSGASGLAALSRSYTRFGMAWVDFDNDGYLDLYQANGTITTHGRTYSEHDPYAEPNLLFRGLPGPRFEEVLPRGGTVPSLIATSRAAAFGDLDGDGGIDVLVVNRDEPPYLLMNQVSDRGHWLRVRVLGRDQGPALGATVHARIAGGWQRRDVQTAYSYQAANEPTVHFGLGEVNRVGALEVRWRDGAHRCLGEVDSVDREIEIGPNDGEPCPTPSDTPRRPGSRYRR